MQKNIFYIMGVSGCGKSTVGKLLAEELNFPFFDGDDYHPAENLEKMASGKALTDKDRMGWLKTLNHLAQQYVDSGAVIACSALKRSYRDLLRYDLKEQSTFVYLKGSFSEIQARLEQRKGHFMPTALLKSQFDALEIPTDAITVAIEMKPEEIVAKILSSIA
ncbi:gluconokinase [Aggregatimonas sangjinii]|uniref:Gluconokinase n=1 Tax=Aggregatimonas sangjinii TaxID=2583587 RepID=A0A5B7STL0_9FLAO|nr:gluconokinase [Aggregatimonas sangjinii]QCX00251.1 gluconokinase [Aggregatimonas sangjinii]